MDWKTEIDKFDREVRNKDITYLHKKVWFRNGIATLNKEKIKELFNESQHKNQTLFKPYKPILYWLCCKMCNRRFGLDRRKLRGRKLLEFCSAECFINA